MSKGRIITGPNGGGDPEPPDNGEEMALPAMNLYWVVWYNPEIEKIERVRLAAHTVEVFETGLLVFKGFVRNDDPALLAVGAPPIYGYYVSSFRDHIRFGQEIPINTQALVH
jgi:hypothetical protein